MWLLDDLNDDIARAGARGLIALAMESDGLAALHALVDMNLQHLLLTQSLASVAGLALVLVVDHLTGTRALVACTLQLLDHGTHLAQGDTNATTRATITSPYRTLFAALAIALGANDVSCKRKLGRLSLVKVFERDVDAMYEVFRSSWARWTTTATATTTTEETTSTPAEELGE